jgi:hypothetical protein
VVIRIVRGRAVGRAPRKPLREEDPLDAFASEQVESMAFPPRLRSRTSAS